MTSSHAQPTTTRCSPSSASCPTTRRRAKATCRPRSWRQSATSSWKRSHLKASLRGYQSFGARFAIVQRKVIIGDEMGLGKTVESLAVLTHLRAKGSHHFLVVCPAAVVTNWVREVSCQVRPAGSSASRPWSRRLAHRLDPQWRRRRDDVRQPGLARGADPRTRLARLLGLRRGSLHQEPRRPAHASFAGTSSERLRAGHPADRHTAGEPDRGVPQPRRLPPTRPHSQCHGVRAASVPQTGRTGVPAAQSGRRPHRAPGARRGRRMDAPVRARTSSTTGPR